MKLAEKVTLKLIEENFEVLWQLFCVSIGVVVTGRLEWYFVVVLQRKNIPEIIQE